MSLKEVELIQRSKQAIIEQILRDLPPEERAAYESNLDAYFDDLIRKASGSTDGKDGFFDIAGLGPTPVASFEDAPYAYVPADFDDAVTPTQLHAVSDLYYIYQHERMKVFQVVDVLQRLFRAGKIRVTQGPGAQALYRLEKQQPLRYSVRDRLVAYRRVFNYGNAETPAGAVVNSNFHRQFVGLMVALAQFFRDLLIGEVIRGSATIDQRPFGSIGTIQRIGLDLRWALDRASYGNVFALALESSHYLKTVMQLLDAADIKKAFDANTKWDVIEIVSQRHLGGMAEPSQRAKMAEAGRSVLKFAADANFSTALDPMLFTSLVRPMGTQSEAWIAAYRMVPEGRSFRGVGPALQSVLGAQSAAV
jgi:hypothetical protein